MTHATAEQIHDHACGFRRSDHVESCADCGRAADVVGEELDALCDVLDTEPAAAKPRPRIGSLALVAAALLLGALSWFLFQPHGIDRTPAAPLPSDEAEIERIVAELQSRSPLRQEIARLAIKMYWGTALEALRRAGADPRLIEEIQGITDEDRDLIRKMKSTKITINLERQLYSEAVYELEKTVGPIEWDFTGIELETAYITFRIQDETVYDAALKLAAALRMPFEVRTGRVRIGRPREFPARSPVRIRPRHADPARHIRELSSDSPAQREKAFEELRRLAFGAEPELWEALDAESLETRSRSAALLKELYVPADYRYLPPPERKAGPPITVQTENKPIGDVLAQILARGGGEHSLVWNARVPFPEQRMSFSVQDIVLDDALRLLLSQFQLACVSLDGTTLVTTPEETGQGQHARWTPPRHVLWTRPEHARAIQPLLEDLDSADAARREKAVRGFRELSPAAALDGLACAARYLEKEALARCQSLRREIAQRENTWIQDLPSGADLQALTPARKARLDAAVAPSDEAQTLDQILRNAGLRADYRATVEAAMKIQGKGPKLSTLLKLVLRSRGLDFYLDGDALVVDTMANVRAAVEK